MSSKGNRKGFGRYWMKRTGNLQCYSVGVYWSLVYCLEIYVVEVPGLCLIYYERDSLETTRFPDRLEDKSE